MSVFGLNPPEWLAEHWRGRDRCLILIDALEPYVQFEALKLLWAADPHRCRNLHVIGFVDTIADHVERIDCDQGRLTLTLHRGPPLITVRRMRVVADVVLFGIRAANDDHLLEWLARKASAPGAQLDGPSTQQTRAVLGRLGFRPTSEGSHARWRHRTRASPLPSDSDLDGARRAIVIGAGLAGSAVATELAQRGWMVEVLEQCDAIAPEASGNPAAAFREHLSLDDCALSRLSRAGVAALDRSLERHGAYADKIAERTGLIEVADSVDDLHRLNALVQAFRLRASEGLEADESSGRQLNQSLDQSLNQSLALLDQRAASIKAGAALRFGGLWLRGAGWVRPPALCARWLGTDQKGLPWGTQIRVQRGVAAHGLQAEAGQWVICDPHGEELARAPIVILANAQTAASLAERAGGALAALRAVPGSIGRFAPDQLNAVSCALSGAGYLLPPTEGEIIAGADYEGGPLNSSALSRLLQHCPEGVAPQFGTRSSVRYATRDHLPVAGAVPAAEPARSWVGVGASVGPGVDAGEGAGSGAVLKRETRLPKIPRLPGLFVLTGFGSRGLVWSALLAQLIAARVNGEPDPLDAALVDAVDPARFWRRDRLKRTIAK